MAERGSDKPGPKKLRFRAVFTADALSADSLETAEKLFARWVVRAFAAGKSEPSPPALHGTSGPQREDADGATDPEPSIPAFGGQA